jgi:hypothetical protein
LRTERVIARLEPRVGDGESNTGGTGGVAFEIGYGAGSMSGACMLSHDELEASRFSHERCGSTVEQLVHNAVMAGGKSVNDGISTGIVFGQRYYVVDDDDEERKVFTGLEDAVVLLCTLANWHIHQKRLLREDSAG